LLNVLSVEDKQWQRIIGHLISHLSQVRGNCQWRWRIKTRGKERCLV